MSGNSQIVIFGRAGAEPRELMQELAGAGLACIFQGVDPKTQEKFGLKLGGSATATAVVVDFGVQSLEAATSILASSPRLKGKIFVLAQDGGKAAEGLVFTTSARLIEDIKRST